MAITVKFRGVRGSIPTPLSGKQVQNKQAANFADYICRWRRSQPSHLQDDYQAFLATLPFWRTSTYGGNTSCVEVVFDTVRFVLDMGTGLIQIGKELFPKMKEEGGLEIYFLLSHVHWDHIQGLPFFAPIYANKADGDLNTWHIYGGTNWQATAETCLAGQMDPPKFPVSWKEIDARTHQLDLQSVFDGKQFNVGPVSIRARRLNHPQETYGWRFEYDGKVVAYTTDNEQFNPDKPDPPLVKLAENADVWINDTQYLEQEYDHELVSRHGWGHSHTRATAVAGVKAGVKNIFTFHHDPGHDDETIYNMQLDTQRHVHNLGGTSVVTAAHEGLEVTL